jgi:hypothetical protein
MDSTRGDALATLQSWQAVKANLRLFVKDLHGKGFRHPVTITEATEDFVTLDFGLGDWVRIALTQAHFQSYNPTDIPPPELIVMPPDVPFVLVISKGILNFILFEVAE